MLHTETVEPLAFSVLSRLMEMPELKDFSLVGGTALSLLYGHRKSVDLDLFSDKPFENAEIINALKEKFKTSFVTRTTNPHFGIFCFIDEVKIVDQRATSHYLFCRCRRKRRSHKPQKPDLERGAEIYQ